jgi:hypothetical protein
MSGGMHFFSEAANLQLKLQGTLGDAGLGLAPTSRGRRLGNRPISRPRAQQQGLAWAWFQAR